MNRKFLRAARELISQYSQQCETDGHEAAKNNLIIKLANERTHVVNLTNLFYQNITGENLND